MSAREFFDLVAEWVDANRRFQKDRDVVDQMTIADRVKKICKEVDRVRSVLKKKEKSNGNKNK